MVILWKVSKWHEGIRQPITPNYFINGHQRQTTANSATLNYHPTLRLRSFQPDQPRTFPNGGYKTNDISWLHYSKTVVK